MLTEHPVYGWPMAPCRRCSRSSVLAATPGGLCFECGAQPEPVRDPSPDRFHTVEPDAVIDVTRP